MALQKTYELENGTSGDYWHIIQYVHNKVRNDDVVELILYASKSARDLGKKPLGETRQFVFDINNNPLSTFDPNDIVDGQVSDIKDLELHSRYLHIKDVGALANSKLEADRNNNEKMALFFLDALEV